MESKSELESELKSLVEIVARLRGPDGCPWDKEQTQKSLTPYIIEEAHELTEAIESGNTAEIKDELGDYLFQVVLQAQVAADEGQFTFSEVVSHLSTKLVRRHPHVFASAAGEQKPDIEEIWRVWQDIKKTEAEKSKPKPLFNYPKTLPALQVAAKIGRKTQTYGFDWENAAQVLKKVEEELHETEVAMQQQDAKAIEEELGDLLFSVAQLARHSGLDPESVLRQGNRKFTSRFEKMLKISGESVESFAKLSNQRKEEIWSQAKKS
jgi:tetrapyrrole methylase family protein/MazG family protein